MIEIKPYSAEFCHIWDDFIEGSKNGTFMLKRAYVEYHADRFKDFSLLFYENDKLLALMPNSLHECVNGSEIRSHGGLTYGGIIANNAINAQKMLELFECLKSYLSVRNITKVLYKRIPAIYYNYPSDCDLYALWRNGANLARRDISSAIYMPNKIHFNERRKRNVKKAIKANLCIRQSSDFQTYITLLSEILRIKHNATPTHSANELIFLASKFPQNIKLFASFDKDEMLAGVVIYETKTTAHAQYIANSLKGRECGALDIIFDKLINEIYVNKMYFDFGISSENNGHDINTGLIQQKQEFGARGIVYDQFMLDICGGGGGNST